MLDPIFLHLDRLRYEEPDAVVLRVRELLPQESLRGKTELLGILASVYRMDLEIFFAKGCVEEGLRYADLLNDDNLRGRLTQRLSYIVSDQKEYELALRLSYKSKIWYEYSGDMAAASTTHVDRGMFFYYLGKTKEAIKCWKLALIKLPSTEELNRFAAHQALGTALESTGLLEEAEGCVAIALKEIEAASSLKPYSIAALHRLQGRILQKFGKSSDACHHFATAFDLYLPISPGQAILAGVDLVQADILEGKIKEARATIEKLKRIALKLNINPIVCEALLDLYQCEKLSYGTVNEISSRVASAMTENIELDAGIWKNA